MIYSYFGIGFGLTAILLPLISIGKNNRDIKKAVKYLFASLVSCVVSVSMQMFYFSRLIKAEDWASLMDISGAISVVCIVFVTAAVWLNLVALAGYIVSKKD